MDTTGQSYPGRQMLEKHAVTLLAWAVAYFYARQFAFLYPAAKQSVMLIWPVSGIGLAAFLMTPKRLWPATLATLFAVGLASNLLHGRVFFTSYGFALADVIESLLCAGLIVRVAGEGVTFTRAKEIAALLIAATGITAATACLAATVAVIAGVSSFRPFWQTWWISGGIGNLIVGPLIVGWLRGISTQRTVRWARVAEAAVFAGSLLVVTLLALRADVPPEVMAPRPFMLIAFVAWGAVRFGSRAVAAALTLFAAVALCSESVIAGPLSIWGGDCYPDRILLLQVFLAFTAAFGYVLASAYAEAQHDRALARDNEARLLFALNASHMGAWDMSLDDFSFCPSLTRDRIFGYSSQQDDWSVERALAHVIPEDRERVMAQLQQAVTGGDWPNCECRIRRVDGQVRWLLAMGSVRVDEQTGGRRVVGIVRDITAYKEAEIALRRRTHQLAQLASELTLAEHRERLRLAGLMHDHLQQYLVGARMQADLVLPEMENAEHRQHLQLASATLGEAIEMSRNITAEISPPVLFHGGLPSALRWLGRELGRKLNLTIDVETPDNEGNLPEVIASLVFNAAKELLLNVSKHSGAREAFVSVRFRGAFVELDVEDNGKGFDPGRSVAEPDNPHFGLFSIRERVEALGGTVLIQAAPGKGTLISLTLPVAVGE